MILVTSHLQLKSSNCLVEYNVMIVYNQGLRCGCPYLFLLYIFHSRSILELSMVQEQSVVVFARTLVGGSDPWRPHVDVVEGSHTRDPLFAGQAVAL